MIVKSEKNNEQKETIRNKNRIEMCLLLEMAVSGYSINGHLLISKGKNFIGVSSDIEIFSNVKCSHTS